MKVNKICILIPLGILNALEAYEAKSSEADIKKLESIFKAHELDETPYEIGVEYPTEGLEKILVSDLIVKAYLAGIDKALSKSEEIEREALDQDNLALYRSRL